MNIQSLSVVEIDKIHPNVMVHTTIQNEQYQAHCPLLTKFENACVLVINWIQVK